MLSLRLPAFTPRREQYALDLRAPRGGVDAMRPDTSDWRNDSSYEFFDSLPIEGLAWECLRRSHPYQEHYANLVDAGAETLPLPHEAQQRWGLRFSGKTRPFRCRANGGVVAVERSNRRLPDAPAKLPALCPECARRQVRREA
ncbi:transcriptional regulator domain-containing protein [Novosphingobium naphthalenivorans]|uniref:transcriptional regulator domain-containing protein n=1 Tax=Novosphingobium naphthalenivorans TaxID=273168 RepID=UPI0035712B06